MKKHTTILFIGSDPYHKASAQFLAHSSNIKLVTMDLLTDRFCSLQQIDYDIAIIDYRDLYKQHPYLISQFSSKLTIYTGSQLPPLDDIFEWPGNVRRFVNKKLGIEALFQAAQEVVDAWAC